MLKSQDTQGFNNSKSVLRESEEIFRLMVESLQDYAIFLLDNTGHVRTWNLGAARLKGYSPEEIIGKHFSVFFTEEDIQAGKPEKELKQARETGRFEDTGWCIPKDGSRLWTNTILTALRDSRGELQGFCKIARDLTEQNRAMELLRESEERLRLMVESVQDYSIFMLDADGNIVSWNVGAERLKGYTREEAVGKNFSIFYTEADMQSGKPARNLATALREGHFIDEGWRLRKDGTRFWAYVVITPLKDKTGTLRGYAKVTRDMTDRKKAEEELERKVAERTMVLEQANRELSQFAYVASHDLQEPLRMVAMYVDLLEGRCQTKMDPEERQYLKYAAEGALRAQQLIRDLLEYSQVGRFEINKEEEIDLNVLVRGVIGGLQMALKEAAAEVDLCPLPKIKADPTQMAQLFQNLISNGIKYRQDGRRPHIRVAALENRNEWLLSVEDNGIGIAPEFHTKVFELFQRLHSKNKYPGTGLGLAICKKIVERHGGRIWLESEQGRGSVFKFTLPKK